MQIQHALNTGDTYFRLSGIGILGFTTIVLAGTNVNGLLIKSLAGCVLPLAGTDAALDFSYNAGGRYFFTMWALQAATPISVPYILPQPVLIPAGFRLEYSVPNATRFAFQMTYRIL